MSQSQTKSAVFERVGECLLRLASTGGFYARVWIRGKQIRRSLETKDWQLAKRRLREMRKELEKLDIEATKTTLGDYLETFLATSQQRSKSSRQKHEAINKRIKEEWPGGPDQKLRDVKPSDVLRWLQKQRERYASSTYNEYLNWSPSATPGGRLLFRLVPSMPDTEETECGLWPTPITAYDGRTMEAWEEAKVKAEAKRKAGHYKKGCGTSGMMDLQRAARLWPTPTCQDAKNNGAPSQMERNTKPLNAEVGGALNPEWVEWLMGYPVGWTDLRDLETPSCHKSPPKSSDA